MRRWEKWEKWEKWVCWFFGLLMGFLDLEEERGSCSWAGVDL
jgi:hypothetical protein